MTKIGIGITTRNRPLQLARTINQIVRLSPYDVKIVVVDDASDMHIVSDFRFEERVGIAAAKNKCLELLDDCEHIFLFDDDAYPIAYGWWLPYVESPEPHLMYQFLDLATERKLNDVTELYRDAEHVALSGPRGVMLYVERSVLDVVGGMDPIYGSFGYEHGDWSNRIHHEGLTSWRYADVVGSEKLIYSLDEHEAIERSVPLDERQEWVRRNATIHNQRRESGYRAFVPYKPLNNVVLTSFFTSKPDPQHPTEPLEQWAILPLLDSLQGEKLLAFTDHDDNLSLIDIDYEIHELVINVYFERHLAAYQWLRAHPEIDFVWCVDATDVEMLHKPWDKMTKGLLYLGSEPTTVATPWLRANHRSQLMGQFIARYRRYPLLNAGLIGGDRETVMAFLHKMIEVYFDTETRLFHGRDIEGNGLGDMAVLNYVARTFFPDQLVHGGEINTVFKAYERESSAWFRHK